MSVATMQMSLPSSDGYERCLPVERVISLSDKTFAVIHAYREKYTLAIYSSPSPHLVGYTNCFGSKYDGVDIAECSFGPNLAKGLLVSCGRALTVLDLSDLQRLTSAVIPIDWRERVFLNKIVEVDEQKFFILGHHSNAFRRFASFGGLYSIAKDCLELIKKYPLANELSFNPVILASEEKIFFSSQKSGWISIKPTFICWDMVAEETFEIEGGPAISCALDVGDAIITGDRTGRIRVWSKEPFEHLYDCDPVDTSPVTALSRLPNGVAVGHESGHICIWKSIHGNHQILHKINISDSPIQCLFYQGCDLWVYLGNSLLSLDVSTGGTLYSKKSTFIRCFIGESGRVNWWTKDAFGVFYVPVTRKMEVAHQTYCEAARFKLLGHVTAIAGMDAERISDERVPTQFDRVVSTIKHAPPLLSFLQNFAWIGSRIPVHSSLVISAFNKAFGWLQGRERKEVRDRLVRIFRTVSSYEEFCGEVACHLVFLHWERLASSDEQEIERLAGEHTTKLVEAMSKPDFKFSRDGLVPALASLALDGIEPIRERPLYRN